MEAPIPHSTNQSSQTKHVVIIGGGFAGLKCAEKLKHAPTRVTLIDRQNHHLFQPLLYQVATAALSPAEIASPIRSILRNHTNTQVILDDAESIQPDDSTVLCASGGTFHYDRLVLAAGARTNYFGNADQWSEHALGLKSAKDALDIRNRFLQAFELAEIETDPERKRELLTFLVIGGGPTGVELAGTMAQIARHSIPPDYANINPDEPRVILVEGTSNVLPAYPDNLRDRATRDLRELGVQVILDTLAEDITPDHTTFSDGSIIRTPNIFWGAGVTPVPLAQQLAERTNTETNAGRLTVGPHLEIPNHPNIRAVGDLAYVQHNKLGEVPGTAPAAIQMGAYTGRQIARELKRNEDAPRSTDSPFNYTDKGTLATIGRARAVGLVAGKQVQGKAAWLLWLLVHIAFLVGLKNRAAVLGRWALAYIFWIRGARIMTTQAHPSSSRNDADEGDNARNAA